MPANSPTAPSNEMIETFSEESFVLALACLLLESDEKLLEEPKKTLELK